jgi:hypothetical protein
MLTIISVKIIVNVYVLLAKGIVTIEKYRCQISILTENQLYSDFSRDTFQSNHQKKILLQQIPTLKSPLHQMKICQIIEEVDVKERKLAIKVILYPLKNGVKYKKGF